MPNKHSVFGDSISTFKGFIPKENRWFYDEDNTNGTGVTKPEDTWWMQVIEADGGELLSNASFSGSMVQGAGFPAGCSMKRTEQLLGAHGEYPDVVWVFIGINDYGWGSPEAQLIAGSEAAPKMADGAVDRLAVDPAAPAPKDGALRFGTAYSEMIAHIKTVAPNAEIRCLTLLPGRVSTEDKSTHCYNLRGIPFDDYNEEIRRAVVESGSTLVDIRALGFDYESTDGTHPNTEGMSQIAQLVLAALSAEHGVACSDCAKNDTVNVRERLGMYPDHMRSTCSCNLALEQGCPHADLEPTRWSCVRQD